MTAPLRTDGGAGPKPPKASIPGTIARGVAFVASSLGAVLPGSNAEDAPASRRWLARHALLLAVVCLLAYALAQTGDGIVQNLPLALFLTAAAHHFQRQHNRLSAAQKLSGRLHTAGNSGLATLQGARGGSLGSRSDLSLSDGTLSRVSSAVEGAKRTALGWRSLVRAPKVEQAWETLCSCILQEFVYDLWYQFISSDVEFPHECRNVLNGAFGELAIRGRTLDLPSIVTELCELIAEQLELFRATRAAAGPQFKRQTSFARRDFVIKKILVRDDALHPAVKDEASKRQVWKLLCDKVTRILLKDEDADRPLQLTIVRELLSNTVLMPLLLFFIPDQANALLLWILTMGEEKKEGEEAPKAGDEAKVPKEGDIKWRAKQSEEFENATMRKQSGGTKEPAEPEGGEGEGEGEGEEGGAKHANGNGEGANGLGVAGLLGGVDEADSASLDLTPGFTTRPTAKVVNVEHTATVVAPQRKFYAYTIEVREGTARTWRVTRRYRNFATLHRRMGNLPQYTLNLPPKRILKFGSGANNERYVNKKCEKLDAYLAALLSCDTWECGEVWDFLSPQSQLYSVVSRGQENAIESISSNMLEATQSVSQKFAEVYEGFGRVMGSEMHRIGSAGVRGAKVFSKIVQMQKWSKLSKSKKDAHRLTANELSEHVKLFEELKRLKEAGQLGKHDDPLSFLPEGASDGDDERMIEAYLQEVTKELYLKTAVDHITGPILEVIDVFFQLDTKGWLRRQVLNVTMQLFELLAGGALDKIIKNKLNWVCTEETVSMIVDLITDALWPNGVFMSAEEEPAQQAAGAATPAQTRARSSAGSSATDLHVASPGPATPRERRPPVSSPSLGRSMSMSAVDSTGKENTRLQRALSTFMQPEHIDIVCDEATVIRNKVQEKLLQKSPAKAILALIGKNNYFQGMQDLFDFVQSETMLAQLAQYVMEIILLKEFPELEPIVQNIRAGNLHGAQTNATE